MTRNFDRFVSFVSHAERIWAELDWAEIRRIIRDGAVAFIALTILVAVYTVEGVKSTYRWLQPRLANLLEHPVQAVTNGPVALYNESLLALFLGQATIGEKYIVRIGAFVILTVETVKVTSTAIRQWFSMLTVETATVWAKEQLMG